MPTGYTYAVQNGEDKTLEDYILKCARNFGALMHMRDEPMSAEIRYLEESDYHPNKVKYYYSQLAEYGAMNEEDWQISLDEEHQSQIDKREKRIDAFYEERQRVARMLSKVVKWQPPTEEHEGLKHFAISQLELILNGEYGVNNETFLYKEIKKPSLEEYKTEKITHAREMISYHNKRMEEDRKSNKKINKWISDLFDSLVDK